MRRRCRCGRAGRNTLGPAGDTPAATAAFTIVEVIVVMAIILVLAGLILGTSGYVHNKAARSRAQAEIQAISAALESYKADNGIYPSDTNTNALDAKAASSADPTIATYLAASASLYTALTGDTDGDGAPNNGAKSYMPLKSNQIAGTGAATYVKDPFGYSFGYSTKNAFDTAAGTTPAGGYNPTFDLWSTSGSTTSAGQVNWGKNW